MNDANNRTINADDDTTKEVQQLVAVLKVVGFEFWNARLEWTGFKRVYNRFIIGSKPDAMLPHITELVARRGWDAIPASERNHRLENAYHPIIGTGKGVGEFGVHPGKAHNDNYGVVRLADGKLVDPFWGISGFFTGFGEKFGGETENDGDHATTWRNRLLHMSEMNSKKALTYEWRCFGEGGWKRSEDECTRDEWDGIGLADEFYEPLHETWEQVGFNYRNMEERQWVHQEESEQPEYGGPDYGEGLGFLGEALENDLPMDYREPRSKHEAGKGRFGRQRRRVAKPEGWLFNKASKENRDLPRYLPPGASAFIQKPASAKCNPAIGKCVCDGAMTGNSNAPYWFRRKNQFTGKQWENKNACWKQPSWGRVAAKDAVQMKAPSLKVDQQISWDTTVSKPKEDQNTEKTETKAEPTTGKSRLSSLSVW